MTKLNIEKMVDSKGNEFTHGARFCNGVNPDPLIICTEIKCGVATLQWIGSRSREEEFKLSQESFKTSKWVVFKETNKEKFLKKQNYASKTY